MFYEDKYFSLPEGERPPREAMEESERSWILGGAGLLFSLFGTALPAAFVGGFMAKRAQEQGADASLGKRLAEWNLLLGVVWTLFFFTTVISWTGLSFMTSFVVALLLTAAVGYGVLKGLEALSLRRFLLENIARR